MPGETPADPLLPKPEEKNSLLAFCACLCRCGVLSSGEPSKEQDPFEYSKSEFHEIGHSLKAEHGRKGLKILDEFTALLVVAVACGWKGGVVLWDLTQMWRQFSNPLSTVKFANDIIEATIVYGGALMWYTLCHWSEGMHWFWRLKAWPLPSLMPGGFMPRLAAFSLGFLMFVTSTLVTEGRVPGDKLLEKFGKDKDHWQYCRASSMEPDGMGSYWFARVLRRPPVISENGSLFHCFHVESNFLGLVLPLEFNQSVLQEFVSSNDDYLSRGVMVPSNWFDNQTLNRSLGFPMDKIEPWLPFALDRYPLFSFHCMYQCVKWKSVGLMDLIKNIGTIVAGSAVVVKTSDCISQNFGGRWFNFEIKCIKCPGFMWGLPLVTKETSPEEIASIIRSTRSAPGKGRSKLFAAFVCGLACYAPLRLAARLDNDGFYTVDYYVTAVFLSSLLMACVVRQVNPYKMMMIGYTKDMWLTGKDSFIDRKTHGYRSLDLYEWVHLTQMARANHLFDYARMVDSKDIDSELKTQKKAAAAATAAAEAAGEDESKDEKCEEKAEKAKEKAEVMSKEYLNKFAALRVKTIKEISVVTVSPPLEESFEGAAVSSMISKLVVVRANAVGTVVQKVDDEHIRVRFPKVVPPSVPLLPASIPCVLKYEDAEGTRVPKMLKNKFDIFVPATIPWEKDTWEEWRKTGEKYDFNNHLATKEKIQAALEDPVEDDPKPYQYMFKSLKSAERKAILSVLKDPDTYKKEPQYQYTVAHTPNPGKKEDRWKFDAWLHNTLLKRALPQPQQTDVEESEEAKQFERQKKADDGTGARWEDVEVPLSAIVEAKGDWLDIELDRDRWLKTTYKEAKQLEDKWLAERAGKWDTWRSR